MFKVEAEYPAFSGHEGAMTAENLEEFASSLSEPAATTAESSDLAPTFSVGATALAGASWEVIRNIVGKFVWNWFDSHQEDTVVKFKVKLIVIPVSVTVRVKDCGWLIRALFGDRSATSGTVQPRDLLVG